jgi:hypothetical protein
MLHSAAYKKEGGVTSQTSLRAESNTLKLVLLFIKTDRNQSKKLKLEVPETVRIVNSTPRHPQPTSANPNIDIHRPVSIFGDRIRDFG